MGDGNEPSQDVLSLLMVVEISDHLDMRAQTPGWSLSAEGYPAPARLGVSSNGTLDPSVQFNHEEWPLRWTLLWRGGNRFEVFEAGELWGPESPGDLPKYVECDAKEKKVLTILVKDFLEPDTWGKIVECGTIDLKASLNKPPTTENPPSQGDDDMAVDDAGNGAQPAAEDERGLVPMIGPSAVEVQGQDQEAVQVDGVVLTASSVLKDLRTAC